MKEGLVSVIVPVYNGEDFIVRCLSSLTAQTYENIEVIVINDGSHDGTQRLVEDLSSKDGRIKVVNKTNEGVAVARNVGLDIAEGEFITFADADDWAAVDMVDKLLKALKADENSDIAVCGYFEVTSANIVSKTPFRKETTSIKGVLSQNTPAFSWAKMYRAHLKERMYYPVGVAMGEDTAMIIPLFSYARAFTVVNEPLYYYYQNDGSVTHDNRKTEKMFSYVKGLHVALKNSNPAYINEIAMSIADRIISNEEWFLKNCFADTVEYVSGNMMQYFENNPYIKRSPRLSKILTYPTLKVIPDRLYYDDFGKKEFGEVENACLESWKRNAPNMQIICLNEDNCDIGEAPEYLQEQYKNGEYHEIGVFFKLKKLYETGGVAVGKNGYLNSGIGSIRMEKSVFALRNRYDISDHFFAALPNSKVIGLVLDTYGEDSLYAEQDIPFVNRLKEVLTETYAYNGAGWTVKLDNGNVTVLKCDVLSYNVTKNNVVQILNEDQLKFLNGDYVLTERAVFDYWEQDKNGFYSDREKLKKQLGGKGGSVAITSSDAYTRGLEAELEYMKNSRSWKITAPLRKFMKLIKKEK